MTHRCPITYDPISLDSKYSQRGLRKLSPKLRGLHDLPFTAEELRLEVLRRADKLSIQGVQPKLSARLDVAASSFEITDRGGRYILKPPHPDYPELCANEDLTMRMAAALGIDVPLHGLVYGKDGELTYFIKRFDRQGRADKVHVEDFAQLAGRDRETKYSASMEDVARVVDTFCTFPAIARHQLFVRTLFAYVVGNEDMHLKNFSLIARDGKVELSPAYDFLNTTIVLQKRSPEELALPLRGKKRRLTRADLCDYFAAERLQLNARVIASTLASFENARPTWRDMISNSFLSAAMRAAFTDLLDARFRTLAMVGLS